MKLDKELRNQLWNFIEKENARIEEITGFLNEIETHPNVIEELTASQEKCQLVIEELKTFGKLFSARDISILIEYEHLLIKNNTRIMEFLNDGAGEKALLKLKYSILANLNDQTRCLDTLEVNISKYSK